MIVRKIEGHVSSARSVVEPPQSSRAVNLGTGRVDTINRVPMQLTQTVRRPTPTQATNNISNVMDVECKSIDVKWSVDYDILALNIKITAYMNGKRSKRDLMRKMITAHEEQRLSASTVDEISSLNIKIASLKRQIEELSQTSIMDYKSDTNSILEAYRKISTSGPQVFGQKEVLNVTLACQKSALVEQYLNCAAKYYPLNIVRTKNQAAACPVCHGPIVDDGHQYVCSDCQTTQTKMEVHSEASAENEADKAFKKSTYDSGWNFAEIVRQFQGDYPVVIGEAVLGNIRDHLMKYNGFDIKKATNYDILSAMKSLGMGSWYKHINKIRFLLTGKKPRNIDGYVPRVIRRGELFSEIYDDVKSDDRTNFIHGLHFLWISLVNEGADTDMEDFCLLKSRDCELKGLDAMRRGFPILQKTHPEFRWELHQIP